jgi:hypothetical protein
MKTLYIGILNTGKKEGQGNHLSCLDRELKFNFQHLTYTNFKKICYNRKVYFGEKDVGASKRIAPTVALIFVNGIIFNSDLCHLMIFAFNKSVTANF